MKKKFFYGYFVVGACFLIEFVDAASLSTLSIFLPEFVRDLGISYTSASGIFVFGMVTGFFGGLLAAKVIPVLTPKWSILVGTICLAVSCWMNAMANSLLVLYVSSIIAGLSLPLVGPPSFGDYINRWFYQKRGSMMGIIYAGAALGTAFWLIVLGQIITHVGWRAAQFVMGMACLVFCAPIPIFILRTPEEKNAVPYGDAALSESTKPQTNSEDGLSFREAIRTPSFWCFLLAMSIAHGAFFGYQYYAIPYMQLRGMSVSLSSVVTSLGNLLKVLFVIVVGRLLDRKDPRRTVVLCFLSFILGVAALLYWGNFCQGFFLLAIFSTILVAFANPIQTTGLPTLITRIFGTKGYIMISSVTAAATNLFAAIASFLLGYVQDVTGDMAVGFVIITVPMIVAVGLALVAFSKSNYFCKGAIR